MVGFAAGVLGGLTQGTVGIITSILKAGTAAEFPFGAAALNIIISATPVGILGAAGGAVGEKLWRMPLGPNYDKLIDSDIADMKNVGAGRDGGSITAAQFLQRFVDKTPWAHLDIAGTAMGAPKNEINQSWGSGYGVRLLDRLVADHYEGKP